MTKRSRADSVEMRKPDLRLKENRYLVPPAPDHYTPYQKRQWREEHLQTLMTPTSGSVAKELPSLAQARGRAVASSFQWGGRRSPSLLSKCCKLIPWCLKGLSGLSLLLLVAVCSGQHGPVFQVARVIGAVADLGEATTSVAVSALNVTNTMAAAASTWMIVVVAK